MACFDDEECLGDDWVDDIADYLIAHGVALASKKPLTNGDRIRAMTDEELAKIMSVGCCGGKNGYCIETV